MSGVQFQRRPDAGGFPVLAMSAPCRSFRAPAGRAGRAVSRPRSRTLASWSRQHGRR